MPTGVLFGLGGGLVWWAVFSRDLKILVEGILQGGGVLMGLVGLVGGMMLGHCGANDQDLTMSQFLATRPLTNQQWARWMLWNAAKSSAAAMSLWTLSLIVIVVPLLVSGVVRWDALDGEIRSIWWWWLPVAFLAPWVLGAGLGAIALTGRTQPFLGITLVVFGGGITAGFVIKYVLTDDQQKLFWQVTFAGLGVVLAVLTTWLFVQARRRELLDSLTAWWSLFVWLALLAIVVGLQLVRPELPWLVVVFLCGTLALVVMPLAATPLALAWNRTR